MISQDHPLSPTFMIFLCIRITDSNGCSFIMHTLEQIARNFRVFHRYRAYVVSTSTREVEKFVSGSKGESGYKEYLASFTVFVRQVEFCLMHYVDELGFLPEADSSYS